MLTKRLFVAAAALAGLLAPAAPSQTDWADLQPGTAPPPLSDVAMANDARRGRILLHGGWNGSRDLPDTWEFDGRSWSNVTSAQGPGPRSSHGMAFDAARAEVVMFGGFCGNKCFDDTTWVHDGRAWIQRMPARKPTARANFAFTYDSGRGRTVLFGGLAGSTLGPVGETWEWDGQNWTRIATTNAPSPRYGARMAYDEARQQVVLHGGRDASQRFGDTWVYDGKDWSKRQPRTSPGVRTSHVMIDDALRNRVVLFGGYDGSWHRNDTWEWDGQDWLQRKTPRSPSARSFAAIAHDDLRGRVVLFGGGTTSPVGGTFGYGTIRPPQFDPYGKGCPGTAGLPKLSIDEMPWAGDAWTIAAGPFASRVRFVGLALGSSMTRWGNVQLPFDLTPLGAPGCLVLTSMDTLVSTTPQAGRATWTIQVPTNISLLTSAFHVQAFGLEPVNALNVFTTAGRRGIVGVR